MLLEDFQEQQQESADRKNRGADKIYTFMKRSVGERDMGSSEVYIELIRNSDFERFLDLMKRTNGIINDIEPPKREILNKKVKLVDGWYDDLVNLMPPDMEDKNEIFRETFEKMKVIANGDHPNKNEAIALTMYNLIIYTHPFADGNGRTARLVYFLFSPDIQKEAASLQQDLKNILIERNMKIDTYHDVVNYGWFANQLRGRGLSLAFVNNEFNVRLEGESWGFDLDSIGFLAAYDLMSPEERKLYGHPMDNNGMLMKQSELPDNIKNNLEKKKKELRAQMTRDILGHSLNLNIEAVREFSRELNKAFKHS
ncbi:MAG: Fic family protein [Parcubacteria group bacterium]|jgi:hypothetical protein